VNDPATIARSRCPVVVLAAHPDDETLGASALLGGVPGCAVVVLTDGAPRDPRFRPATYRAAAAEYAITRRGELAEALAIAGVRPGRIHTLGAPDQEAIGAVVPLARELARLLDALRPARVVTHAYEGGHPDHDASALVARGALGLLARAGRPAPRLLEMALYHGGPGRLVAFEFLPWAGVPARDWRLRAAERRRKEAMLSRYASQRDVLGWLGPADVERLRRAPAVDFARPPHEGALWYERMGFSLAPARWRGLAARACTALERERLA
jgi:LmbE family N-acetylglucosaminyl deacetylase